MASSSARNTLLPVLQPLPEEEACCPVLDCNVRVHGALRLARHLKKHTWSQALFLIDAHFLMGWGVERCERCFRILGVRGYDRPVHRCRPGHLSEIDWLRIRGPLTEADFAEMDTWGPQAEQFAPANEAEAAELAAYTAQYNAQKAMEERIERGQENFNDFVNDQDLPF